MTRLILESGRVAGVEGNLLVTDASTGLPVLAAPGDPTAAGVRRLVARAPQVVLAAGALRSPAILQASGVAHPAIGRHLRLHPVPVVAARMAEPVEMWRGIDAGGPFGRVHRRRRRPARLRHRVGAGAPGPDGPGRAVGRGGRPRRAGWRRRTTSPRSSP